MPIQPTKHFLPPVTKSTSGFTGTVPNPASVTVENGLVTHVAQGSPAASSPSPADSGGFQVLVDANDTTPGFLGAKITANAPLSASVANPGADETVELDAANATAGAVGVVQLAGDLGGTATAPKVTGLQGFPVANTTPGSGQVPTWNGSAYTPQTPGGGSGSGLFSYAIVAPPALAAFTWLNQGTATAQNNNAGAIMMSVPNGGAFPTTNWRILYLAAPATPYSLVAHLHSIQFNDGATLSGLYFYDSVSGKLMGLETIGASGTGFYWRVQKLTNATTDSGITPYITLSMQGFHLGFSSGAWGRLRNDGADLFFDISQDGVNWRNLYSEAVGSYLTPDNLGWGGLVQSSNAANFADVSLLSWSVM